jgi:FkbM family methyltransferase
MLNCPVHVPALPRLRTICVDEHATDPLSLECRAGKPRVRQSTALLSLAAPGVSLLEVGAHIGLFALVFAAAGRRVLAVEASPQNFGLLSASARENAFDTLDVQNFAASDREGSLKFVQHGPYGFVTTDRTPDAGEVLEVPCVRLDDWQKTKSLSDRVLVKVDVEGHELHVLDGMREFLRERRLPPLFIESNAHCLNWDGATPEALRDRLLGLGYKIYLCRRAWLRPWSQSFALYPRDGSQLQGTTVENLLCVAPGDDRVILPAPRKALSEADFARELLRTARHSNVASQQAAARVLERLPAERRSEPGIAKVVNTLASNADPEVQRALKTL